MLRRFLQTFWWLLLLGILTMFIFLGLEISASKTAIAAINRLEAVPVEPLLVSIPLPGQHFIKISVPQSVVQEWQRVVSN
ncbi:DUF3122 domain-containing protein [Nostoc sp. 106C]|uniref:DUF3122 domain-containing protein n=1 Tax=Nostoc sp. 106C TaxID=1932667 RepID=UPI000B7661C7|nr:DUF3122 domain-containing protein [Nostoc sp. 106C]OUL17734.1 hypothetical protein BV375_35600 [Nostoc sp. 106C]